MITRNQLLALPFYEKESFKGSLSGMCYLIEGKKTELPPTKEALAANPEAKPVKKKFFRVTIYPGPLCFEKTAKELMQTKDYPLRDDFIEEDLVDITAYLNEQYEQQRALWDTVRYF